MRAMALAAAVYLLTAAPMLCGQVGTIPGRRSKAPALPAAAVKMIEKLRADIVAADQAAEKAGLALTSARTAVDAAVKKAALTGADKWWVETTLDKGDKPPRLHLDDPTALNLLSGHFGNAWNSVSYPIVQREIAEALEEDHAVIGG